MSFGKRIKPYVDAELATARVLEMQGKPSVAFSYLERAHVLAQASTVQHCRTHLKMLGWAIRQRNLKETIGQIYRLIGGAIVTPIGKIPSGNTGGANINALKKLPIEGDLQKIIDSATQ